ncbi:MAG: replication protein P [Pseudomonadota bacterium]
MWKQALSALSDQQLDGLFKFCIDRCMNGNPWPPELSDVIVALSGEAAKHNPFGLDPDEQLRDFLTYCAKRNNYQSAEMYPFKHPIQYWMFTDLRTKMIDLRLTEVECEKRLDKMLSQWTERVRKGEKVPEPTLTLTDKSKPRPAWMDLIEKGKQRTQ